MRILRNEIDRMSFMDLLQSCARTIWKSMTSFSRFLRHCLRLEKMEFEECFD